MKPIQFDDSLETVYDVGETGTVRWHVNPSTRPIVAKSTGKEGAGPPSPPETRQGSPAGAADDPLNDGAAPGGDANADNSLNYNDHPFTVPAGGDNETVSAKVEWATPASDYDITPLRGHQRQRALRRRRARGRHEPERRHERRGGLRGAARPAGRQEVRRAREQLRRRRAVHADHHLHRAAAVQARPGRVLHAHLRAGRARVRHPAGADRPRPVQDARPARVRDRHPAGVRGGQHRVPLGERQAQGRRRAARLQAHPQPRRHRRRLPDLERQPGPQGAPGGAVRQPQEGHQLERQGQPARQDRHRRLLLRALPDEDDRQAQGDTPGHAGPAQRPLRQAAGLLPARDLRPAAELQARAARVRRQQADPAADRLPGRDPRPLRRSPSCAARRSSSGSRPARWPPSARTG